MLSLVRLGRDPEKTIESDTVFAHIHTTSMLRFSDLILVVVTASVNCNVTISMFILSQQFQTGFYVSLWPQLYI